MTIHANNTTYTFETFTKDSDKREVQERIERTFSITSPCCNAPLRVFTQYEGGYNGYEVPSEISCDQCGNSWGPDGKPF